MRIGIDCRTILNPGGGEKAGVGHYTYYLIKNLLALDKKNNYILFFDSRFRGTDEFFQPNVKIKFFPFYQYKKYLPITYSQMLIGAMLAREKLDVFHSPANTLPLTYGGRSVVTVHDLAIYKYPDFFPTKFLNRQIFSTRVLVPRSLAKADKIIAVSKNTKTDIVEEFGIPENKIEVIYEGAVIEKLSQGGQSDLTGIKKKYGLEGEYILFLGTIEPRKNIVNLIKAFRNLKMVYDSPAKNHQLVIAGARGWRDQAVYREIAGANASILGRQNRRSGEERRSGIDIRGEKKIKKEGERRKGAERRRGEPIRYVGYVPHEDKLSLLSHATCFVFPSLYEGFGLPVLEAMGLGVPVVTSNLSSLPEVLGEAGILINPNKESEIIDALQQIITDPGLREIFKVRGLKRAKSFNWRHCAEKTLEIYESVVNPEN